MRLNNWVKFFTVLVIIGILTYLTAYGSPALKIPSLNETRYGIDIKGGVNTTLYPDLPEGTKPTEDQLKSAKAIIERRLDNKGIYDRNVTLENENQRIIVEIPYKQGEKDFNPQTAINEIGKTALLTFQEVDQTKVDSNGRYLPTGKIVIQGTDVEDAKVETDSRTGAVVVALKLNSEGAKKFDGGTGRLVGKPLAIFMDEQLIAAPTVSERISGGNAVINGQRDAKEAGELADTIRSGSLPFKLVAKQINSISPTLGEGALMVTVNAGIVAFAIVCLFMLAFYRLPGLFASIALFGLVVLQLLVINVLQISVTLPGIAGIILSVGMGVDANVIIFERIKEEMRNGKTLKAAIDVGFRRAFSAILDGNVTTLIAAAVLYWLGTGPIKGFAITLFLGVALSFITAITASRIMIKSIASANAAKKRWLYGA